MGDASEENYLPGPLLDTREVWKFVEINQNRQIIIIVYLYPFPSAWLSSLLPQKRMTPTQIVVETEGSFSDFRFPPCNNTVQLGSSEPVI